MNDDIFNDSIVLHMYKIWLERSLQYAVLWFAVV